MSTTHGCSRLWWVTVVFVLVTLCWPGTLAEARALDSISEPQEATLEQGDALRKGATEWSVVVAGADAASVSRSETDRQFLMLTLGWAKVVTRQRGRGLLAGRLELAGEMTPLFIVFQSTQAYGAGLTPVSFRWNFVHAPRLAPYVELAGGMLWTDRAVPEGTTQFNFTAHAGLGVRLRVSERSRLLLGYRYLHLSNGGRAAANPGVNSNSVYGGISFLR